MRTVAPIDVSIIVPVHNEAEALAVFATQLIETIEAMTTQYEIIWIDDGSTDETKDFLQSLVQIHTCCRAYCLPKKTYKSGALRLGFQLARGKRVVTIDGDGQDDPKSIALLLEAIDNGADVAIGWRKNRADALPKKINSRLINWLSSKLLGQNFKDMNSGLKVFTQSAANAVQFQGSLYRFLPYLLNAKGFTIVEIPVHHRQRLAGKSKFTLLHRYRSLADVLLVVVITRLHQNPLRWLGSAGVALFVIGFSVFSWLSFSWLQGQSIGTRPLFFTALSAMIMGIQIASLGLIAEFIVRWHNSNTPIDANELQSEIT